MIMSNIILELVNEVEEDNYTLEEETIFTEQDAFRLLLEDLTVMQRHQDAYIKCLQLRDVVWRSLA